MSIRITSPQSEISPAPEQDAPLFDLLDFMLVRAPLFPIETYYALHDPVLAQSCPLSPSNPRIRQELAVGSLSLLDVLERPSISQRKVTRREKKLLRYFIRMATRPTPYGLFAGIALGYWGEQTNLALAETMPRIRTRLDMHWLMHLVWALEALPEIRQHLHFTANSSAYIRGGRVFLLEAAPHDQVSQLSAVSLRATGVVKRALDLARYPISYSNLVDELLVSTPGATRERVENLISELWEHTLLLTDLRPPLTAGDPIVYLKQRLASIPLAVDLVTDLEYLSREMERLDALSLEAGESAYRNLIEMVNRIAEHRLFRQTRLPKGASAEASEIPAGKKSNIGMIGGESRATLQVDMELPLTGQHIAKAVGEEIARAAETLLRISPSPRGFRFLESYRQAFVDRYGADREVALLEVIDPNYGLGLPKEALQPQVASTGSSTSQLREQTLLELALAAWHKRELIAELNEDILQRLETSTSTLVPGNAPHSLDVYAFIAATSATAIDAGEFQVVIGPNIGSFSAGRNLGRFVDLLGAKAESAFRYIASQQESHHPECIWAELVYHPRASRMANVALRPEVRSHEIVYGTTASVANSQVIPIDELVVGVRNERFYLRWPRHNAKVIVCSGHMLNPLHAPEIVRFLSVLDLDNTPLFSGFQWGTAEAFPFLPRIQIGRTVLRLAQWDMNSPLYRKDLLFAAPEHFWQSLQNWRESWNVPRYIYLAEGDQRLLLDLEDPQQVEELRTALLSAKGDQRVLIQEGVPAPNQAWVKGPGGHFVAEIVVSLILRKKDLREEFSHADLGSHIPSEASALDLPNQIISPAVRLRPLGSDWLFVKLYCGRDLQEDLIGTALRKFAQDVITNKLADDWFFLRYADPEPHLRLRFHGDPTILTRQLLPELCAWSQWLIDEGLCLKFSFDVYDREVERYGGPGGMLAAETLFYADSCAVVEMQHLLQTRQLKIDRTLVAALSIDDLLARLKLTPSMRRDWYRKQVISRHESGGAYRQHGRQLRTLLGIPNALSTLADGNQLESIFAKRGLLLEQVTQQLSNLIAHNQLSQALPSLYGSFVHLHCNRLLGTDRTGEQTVLGLLLRTCEGLAKMPVT